MKLDKVIVFSAVSIVALAFLGQFVFASEAVMDGSVSKGSLQNVAGQKVFFGHKSVGYNILNGIEDIYSQSGIPVNVVEGKGGNLDSSVLLHAPVGQNKYPKSKIDEFSAILHSGIGKSVDVAFLKLCYVDIRGATDIHDVFNYYKLKMDEIKQSFPKLKIVHLTVPLKVNKVNWKTKIKETFGVGELWEYRDNVRRNEYNRLLLDEYSGRAPVFDIALYESTLKSGARAEFSRGGKVYHQLYEEYTDDGGHLNIVGRRWVATKLVEYLAEL